MRIFMLGAGGHARSVADALADTSIEAVVLRDIGDEHHEPIASRLISEAELAQLDPTVVQLVNGIGQTAAGGVRWETYVRFHEHGFAFRSVIHPSAYVSPNARLAEGVQVLAAAVVGPGATVGANTLINSGAIVEHDCEVGAGVHVAPGAVLCGGVSIGDGSMIGAGATVVPGRVVAHACQIGAGGLLLEDLQDGQIVAGVPARSLQ